MKKRMIAACLVGVMILGPGCYPWASTTDRQRIAESRRFMTSRRIRESPRIPPTQKEHTGSSAEGGLALMGVGAGVLAITHFPLLFMEMGASEEEKEEFLSGSEGLRNACYGLMGTGFLVCLFSPALDRRNSKRTQLSIAPNGCRFTYRF
jgi:hypothetical protein